jgi:hypothetical protein
MEASSLAFRFFSHTPMTPSSFRAPFLNASPSAGPWFIAAGLSMLLACVLCPVIPAVTAMAIVTLGATLATLVRFRQSPAIATLMLLHAAVYLSLYVTFVCAVLYKPVEAYSHALSVFTALDLAASIVPIALALQAVGSALRPAAESRP